MVMKKLFWKIIGRPSSLQEDILQRFGISEKFFLEYKKQQSGLDWTKGNWEDFLGSMNPVSQMYVAFALSTVLRGRDMFSLLDSYSCIRHRKRYLDIGTAYAGFLRAFKEQGFEEVVGIELQEHLANLGRANMDGLDNARVILGDFLREDYSSLGVFDVVTCNDVIEHVDDAAAAIRKMCSMVGAEGCLALEVPNKDCIDFVRSDGHYQIFGITQLGRNDAADYYSQALGADRSDYLFEMGEMYELDWYIEQLSNNGLTVMIADTHRIARIQDVPTLLDKLRQAREDSRVNVQPRMDRLVVAKLTNAVDAYIQELERDISQAKDEASIKRFEDKYLRSFWTILAIKGRRYAAEDLEHAYDGNVGSVQKF